MHALSRRLVPIDALLLLMSVIWGTNYSIVKHAFSELDPHAFNAVRMGLGSSIFLMTIVVIARRRTGIATEDTESPSSVFHSPAALTGRDWIGLIGLGVVGHFLYQYLFITGLALTSVANSSLMLASTPVVIAIVTAAMGWDRLGWPHWIGAALSTAGIYAVVGRGVQLGTESVRGDLCMAAAVGCWAAYTLGAGKLMARHSPVGVTGLSMAIGTLLYIVAMLPHLMTVSWRTVGIGTWLAILYSAIFALCVSYTIWYAAVREIGSSRTAVYSNLVPVVAMLTAIVFLGEPFSARKMLGAAAVLSGVALTRVARTSLVIPAEE